MKISKSIALDIAKSLTDKKRKEVVALEENLKAITTEIANSKIPKEVLAFHKKFPKYCYLSSDIRVSGNGFNFETFNTKEFPSENTWMKNVVLDKSQATKLQEASHKYDDARKEYKKLFSEIELACLQLSTSKRISEKFPEAIPFLPKENVSQALSVNIDQIRKKLTIK